MPKVQKKQKQQSKELSPREIIEGIIDRGEQAEIRGLFVFDNTESEEEILYRFSLWSRYFFYQFFEVDDAPFHKDMDMAILRAYLGRDDSLLNIAFRGAAKTTRLKLFIAYAIANDETHTRRNIKVLSADGKNATQIVTDVYNMMVTERMLYYYPEIFQKQGKLKREEQMGSFTTSHGVKMFADTVGTDQRGDIQMEARPDFIWFDDFETRKTLRSATITKAIWDNMQEAYDGMSRGGRAIYNCNYVSERGNVHRLVLRSHQGHLDLIKIPIKDEKGEPTWPAAYTKADIDQIEKTSDDFAGERMCEPSAGADVMFDRTTLNNMKTRQPVRELAGFKIFHEYNASHRYGSGHDVALGVGLDSSTSVFIDFSTTPNRVVATYANDLIKPDVFGDEIKLQADRFGGCIVAPESNNAGHATIGRLKQIYDNIFFREEKETRVGMPPRIRHYGFDTNLATKPQIVSDLKKGVEDGLLELTDEALILEMKSYTRDDLMDKEDDVRLTTRHFDLLMACAIAWHMRNYAEQTKENIQAYQQPDYEPPTQ